MTYPAEILIADAEKALRAELASAEKTATDEAFAAWLLGNGDLSILTKLRDEAAACAGAARTYREVATLSFAGEVGLLPSSAREALVDGLGWLAGREPVVAGCPMGFVTDAVAVLGIALGARAAGGPVKDRVAAWASKFITQSASLPKLGDWDQAVMTIAGSTLAISGLAVPTGASVADARVALRSKGLITQDGAEEDEALALDALRRGVAPEGYVRAVSRLAALAWSRRQRAIVPAPSAWTVADVANVLRRVGPALRLWTWEAKPRTSGEGAQARKWYVDHEYHVQNLLWTILAPMFPDLVNEENLPSLGQKKPRADFGIASLKLIVEAKFMRKGDSPQKMIGQIAEDASLYLAERTRFQSIVAFVWDDSRRSEEHDFMIQGIRKIQGVADAIVVSRPGALG